MTKIVEVDHPCLRRVKVPILMGEPAKPGSQEVSPYAASLIAYAFREDA